jgi:hypothetical protein
MDRIALREVWSASEVPMLALLLAQVAVAADFEMHVSAPGAKPVWATIRDVAPGATKEFVVDGPRGKDYLVKATVLDGADEGAWRIAFDVRSTKGRRSTPEIVAAPVMQSPTGELAQFIIGGTAPVPGAQDVYVFHGTTIDWIVRDGGQPH